MHESIERGTVTNDREAVPNRGVATSNHCEVDTNDHEAVSNHPVAVSKHREADTIRSVATSNCSLGTFIHFTLFTIHFSLLTTGPVPLDNQKNTRIIVLQQNLLSNK